MSESQLSFITRLWFAWVCFFRVLFDASFASIAFRAHKGELPEKAPDKKLPEKAAEPEEKKPKERPKPEPPSLPPATPALQLLALLQREGRLIDFLEQDIASFPDAEIGAAVRVVHEGCRKAIRDHLKINPLRPEDEGASVTLEAGFSPAEVKLSGNVQGKPPYRGVLRHRGWRGENLVLPTPVAGFDPSVLAPAEVEL